MLNQKKFVVTPKTESSVTVTVRIEKESHDRLEELVLKVVAAETNLLTKLLNLLLIILNLTTEKRNKIIPLFFCRCSN